MQLIMQSVVDCEASKVSEAISENILNLSRTVAEMVGTEDIEKRRRLIEEARKILRQMASDLNYASFGDEEQRHLCLMLKDVEAKIVAFSCSQKSILILTAKMGHGHLNAAIATKEGLRHLYGYDYRIEVIDFLEMIGSFMNKTTQKILLGSAKYSNNFNRFIYESTDKEGPIKLLNALNYPLVLKKVKKMFEEKQPDLIVSTFPLWDHLIQEIGKKAAMKTRFMNIITDSINVHSYWTFADHDYHIVANEETAQSVKAMGVAPGKIKTLGLPVRLQFMQETSRKDFCADYDLDPEKRYVLYLAMDDRVKQALVNIEQLLNSGWEVLVVTGRNKKLMPKLEEKVGDPRVHVFGWINDLHRFMRHSDALVTKAGGATVMEAIATETPLIISSILAGQEEGNAELVRKHKLGVVMPEKGGDLGKAVQEIAEDYQEMKKRLAKMSNADASLKVAKFISEVV